ncbi:hypothetical protein ELG63_36565 [Rhizobium leguminosarum]|uniref:hypothetical protein n=1 Tax=Rhizobium leguminosarum TaxID=384 RepID=UPI00102FE6BB|nr:hypothetical protein [Rhizobium leguminosarum]TBH28204.1 hypothetical protein ELG63_36565 [Rhizobium leguminosarum]
MSNINENDDLTEIGMTLVAALMDTVNETAASMAEVHNSRADALNEKFPTPASMEEAGYTTAAICYNQDIKTITKLMDLGKELAVVLQQLEHVQELKAKYQAYASNEIDQAQNATSSRSIM